jgi:hypothetical protein
MQLLAFSTNRPFLTCDQILAFNVSTRSSFSHGRSRSLRPKCP